MGKWAYRVAEALEKSDHHVTLWFGRDVVGPAASTFARTIVYPVRLARLLVNRRAEFDAVIVHEPGGVWYGLARKVAPSLPPMIAMCHNVESKCFDQRLRGAGAGYASVPWSTRIKQALFRTWQSNGTIRLADHVLCLSVEDRAYLIGTLGRNPDRVTSVVNGVAPEDFAERTPSVALSILFVGGWLEIKGARLLPVAFRRVRERFSDVRLTVLGSGVPEAAVLRDFDAIDREHVHVTPGPIGASAVRDAYRSHSVFFMPSLSEGSPLSLLEAMAAGTPIVAAKAGGIPDIVRDGTDGLLFEPATPDAAAEILTRVLSDASRARALGLAGRQRACGFSWAGTALGIEQAARKAAGRAE